MLTKFQSLFLTILIITAFSAVSAFCDSNNSLNVVSDPEFGESESISPAAGSKIAQLNARLDQFREELRLLKGTFEENDYRYSNKLKRQIDEITRGFSKRLSLLEKSVYGLEEKVGLIEEKIDKNTNKILYLEQYTGYESSSGTGAIVKPEGAAIQNLSEDQLYNRAKALYDQKDYKSAKDEFDYFLKKYSKSEKVDNAQFWIGEIYYTRKWYEKAILEYQKVIENYKGGNKVPAAYLKQGLSFLNLGEKASAQLILKELIKKYPDSKEADLARKKLKK